MSTTPPKEIPESLYDAYTMNGRARVFEWYCNDVLAENESRSFSAADFQQYLDRAEAREESYYGKTDTWLFQALEKHRITGQDVLVFGSVQPWYEAVALHYGAAQVDVLDYQPCIVEHTKVNWLGYPELEKQPRTWPVAISISSFEHDGLGRYGDPLDPDGDIKAMNRAIELLEPGGLLFLSVPVGEDAVFWNAHRIYGRIRLPMLLEHVDVVDTFGFDEAMMDITHPSVYQPVFAIRKKA